MPGDRRILEAVGLLLGGEQFDILAQRPLIALERQHVVGLLGEDFLGDVALAADRVDGDDGALDRQEIEQLGDGDDLVRFVRHLDLAEHEALMRGEGRDHVDRRLAVPPIGRAPQGLAIDRKEPRVGDLLHRLHPAQQAFLERARVDTGQDAREGVVGRDAVRKSEKIT